MKFIILSQARQGSTLLQNMLSSHPQIHFEGEILKQTKGQPRIKKKTEDWFKKKFPQAYLSFQSRSSQKRHWGFKLILNQVENPVQFVDQLYQNGYQLIDLRRENGLDVALSACLATKSGVWFVNRKIETNNQTYYIEPELLFQRLAHFENQVALQNKIIDNKLVFRVNYANDLSSVEKREALGIRFCEHFKITPSSMPGETFKSDERSHQEKISNYTQLIEALRVSEFSHFSPGY